MKHHFRPFGSKTLVSIILAIILAIPQTMVAFAEQGGPIYGPSNLKLQTLEGYTLKNATLRISIKELGGDYRGTYNYLGGNHFDLSSFLIINNNYHYKLQLSAEYELDHQKYLYYDTIDLSAAELIQFQEWPIHSNFASIQFSKQWIDQFSNSDVRFLLSSEGVNQQFDEVALPSSTILLTSPREFNFTFTGINNTASYYLTKPLSINHASVGQAVYLDFEQEKNQAISLDVNPAIQEMQFQSPPFRTVDLNVASTQVKQLYVSPGNYNITLKTNEFNQRQVRTEWMAKGEISANHKLFFADQVTDGEFKIFSYDRDRGHIRYETDLYRGDYQFKGYTGASPKDLYHVIIKKDGEVIYTNKDLEYVYPYIFLKEKLTPGTYTFEISQQYSDHQAPFVFRKTFPFTGPGEEIGGLPVKAENELGDILKSGKIYLFESFAQSIKFEDDALATNLVFQKELKEGQSFIPHAYLLHGKKYDLVVMGSSNNGEPIMYHRSFIAGREGELTFTNEQLTHLLYSSKSSVTLQKMLITFKPKDDLAKTLTWPFPIVLKGEDYNHGNNQGMYISSSDWVQATVTLEDREKETGYYITKQFETNLPELNLKLLDESLVKMTLADGLNGKIGLTESYGAPGFRAKEFYISKGTQARVHYFIQQGGYNFVIERVDSITTDEQLPNKLIIKNPQSFISNDGIVMIYSTIDDKYSIQDIFQENMSGEMESQDLKKQTEADEAFKVINSEGQKTIEAVYGADGVIFKENSSLDSSIRVKSSQTAINNKALLRYQFYNSQGNKVGDPIETYSVAYIPVSFKVKPTETLTLKLEEQYFPNDFVELYSETKIDPSSWNKPQGHQITVESPNGDAKEKLKISDAQLWELVPQSNGIVDKVIYELFPRWDEKIVIHPSKIKLDAKYVLNITANYDDKKYYRQLSLTGKELLELDTIKASSTLYTYTATPTKGRNFIGHVVFFMNVEGTQQYYTPSIGNQYTLITNVAQANVRICLADGEAVYDLSKEVNGVPNAITNFNLKEELAKAIPITLKTENGKDVPFSGFIEFDENYTSGFNFWQQEAYPRTYSKLYTNPDKRYISFLLPNESTTETPWLYEWKVPPLDVKDATDIVLSEQFSKQQLNDFKTYVDSNGRVHVTSNVELFRGALKLQTIYVYREEKRFNMQATSLTAQPAESVIQPYKGKFDFAKTVNATITVKDASKRTVYQAETSQYDTFDIQFATSLNPGEYTLTYSLPTGPRTGIELTKTFKIGDNGNPGGGDNPGGGQGGGPGGGSGGGSGGPSGPSSPNGGTAPVTPTAPEKGADKSVMSFAVDQIPAASNGKIVVQVKDQQVREIRLPGTIGSIAGTNSVGIELANGSITLSPKVLKQLSALLPTNSTNGGQVSILVRNLAKDDIQSLHSKAGISNRNEWAAAGAYFEVKLAVVQEDGKTQGLPVWNEAIRVKLRADEIANSSSALQTIYSFQASGAPRYIGGTNKDNFVETLISQDGIYGVLKYAKTYSDVSSTHWAYAAINELSARDIVQGGGQNAFNPNQPVTRAVFAQILMKALGLKASGLTTFKDVEADMWYSDAIAAVSEKGFMRGISDSHFDPKKIMTREEMAVTLASVLKYIGKTFDGAKTSLNDKQSISSWAQDAVSQVAASGLMTGNSKGAFVPKSSATRAETAVVIIRLLHLE